MTEEGIGGLAGAVLGAESGGIWDLLPGHTSDVEELLAAFSTVVVSWARLLKSPSRDTQMFVDDPVVGSEEAVGWSHGHVKPGCCRLWCPWHGGGSLCTKPCCRVPIHSQSPNRCSAPSTRRTRASTTASPPTMRAQPAARSRTWKRVSVSAEPCPAGRWVPFSCDPRCAGTRALPGSGGRRRGRTKEQLEDRHAGPLLIL